MSVSNGVRLTTKTYSIKQLVTLLTVSLDLAVIRVALLVTGNFPSQVVRMLLLKFLRYQRVTDFNVGFEERDACTKASAFEIACAFLCACQKMKTHRHA